MQYSFKDSHAFLSEAMEAEAQRQPNAYVQSQLIDNSSDRVTQVVVTRSHAFSCDRRSIDQKEIYLACMGLNSQHPHLSSSVC